MPLSEDLSSDQKQRQKRLGVLAKARTSELEDAIDALGALPSYEFLRQPECGLAMIQGRAGGTGGRFSLGEVSVTRAAVRLATGTTGFGYVQGRDHRHAELAAVFDAIAQDGNADTEKVIDGLAAAQEARRRREVRRAAKTKVEFFTMVRGD